MNADPEDRADIVALPPVILLIGIVLGLGLDALIPIPLATFDGRVWVGGAVILISLAILPFVLRQFHLHGTSFDGRTPTDAIITTGPYAFSRNPGYLLSYGLQIGLAIALNSAWLLVTLAPTIIVTHYGVILREEAYLERKFGDSYRSYKARIRRYL